MPVFDQQLLYSVYFAPRGYQRMVWVGRHIAHVHLSTFDRLIGIVGEAGSGKSLLIRGMFPGLELTNDDDGVNTRPLPLLDIGSGGFYEAHTYHVDIRFEMAFTQIHTLADAVRNAIDKGKRVIVEHFELISPYLDFNAELLIGVGEEIIVTRPTIFGPEPQEIADISFASNIYRRMAHTAEDITERAMWFSGYANDYNHGDIRHGFLLEFDKKPEFDIAEVSAFVKERIARNSPVSYVDDQHIRFGEKLHGCTGPRIHVRFTGDIENFRLLPELKYDPLSGKYLLIGLVGREEPGRIDQVNRIRALFS